MLRRRLDPERHGSAGYTSAIRVAAIVCVFGLGFLGLRLTTQTLYDGRIMPGVVVGGQNLGGLTLAEARRAVFGSGCPLPC
jgi:hypothetical protein